MATFDEFYRSLSEDSNKRGEYGETFLFFGSNQSA